MEFSGLSNLGMIYCFFFEIFRTEKVDISGLRYLGLR